MKKPPFWQQHIFNLVGLGLGLLGLYVGITRQLAVTDTRVEALQQQIVGLRENVNGLEKYIIDLYREGRKR